MHHELHYFPASLLPPLQSELLDGSTAGHAATCDKIINIPGDRPSASPTENVASPAKMRSSLLAHSPEKGQQDRVPSIGLVPAHWSQEITSAVPLERPIVDVGWELAHRQLLLARRKEEEESV